MPSNTRHLKPNTGSRIAFGALIVLVFLFLFLCSVHAFGGVGRMVYSFYVGFFGLAGYALAIVGIICGLALIFNLRIKLPARKILLFSGLMALAVLALQIYSSSAHIVGADYGKYLLNCYNYTNTAGGMLFGIVAYPLMKFITTAGALGVVCAIFFVVAGLSLVPFFKRNVTYTSSSKKERIAASSGFSMRGAAKKYESGTSLSSTRKQPVLTDFSADPSSQEGTFYINTDGTDRVRNGKRRKGAGGYNALYPNENGSLEDDERIPVQSFDLSSKTYAQDILFSNTPKEDSYSRFRVTSDPKDALSNVSAPYSAIKRNELKRKLGIDEAETAAPETNKYKLYNTGIAGGNDAINKNSSADDGSHADSSTSQQNSARRNAESFEGFENEANKSGNGEVRGVTGDFFSMQAEQEKRFSEMFATGKIKPEFQSTAYDKPQDKGEAIHADLIKNEVVRPSRGMPKPAYNSGDSILSTIEKAQAAAAGNLSGLHGAVERALDGDKRTDSDTELNAEAYTQPETVKPVQKDILGRNIVRPDFSVMPEEKPETRIPRAFADTSIYGSGIDKESSAHFGNGLKNIAESASQFNGNAKRTAEAEKNLSAEQCQILRTFGSGASGQSKTFNNDRTVNLSDVKLNGYEKEKPDGSARIGSTASVRDMDSIPKVLPREGETFEQADIRTKLDELKLARAARNGVNNDDKERENRMREEVDRQKEMREAKLKAAEQRGYNSEAKGNVRTYITNENMRTNEGNKPFVKPVQITMEQAISKVTPKKPYVAPPLKLLIPPEPPMQAEDFEPKKKTLLDTLAFFGVDGEISDVRSGPTFSLYEVKVNMRKGQSVTSIASKEHDIAMRLEEENVRILAPIPGKNAVGFEVPNKNRRIVRLSEILCSPSFNNAKSPATFALGKNLYGDNFVCDINKLPHMLIAGATGAGKSCCINSIIISLLYKASPEDVRLILIDPKRVELSVYAGIPHLMLDEIVCDVDKAIRALNWACAEMSRRTKFLADVNYRNIDDYNADCEHMGFEKMPRIIIIIDELADLIDMGKKAVEDSINKIARLARAVGINLIVATQRPSVDVISGTIKNNLPSRVVFKVTSQPDSRTVLDGAGAEKLLGNGDLLYMTPKSALLERMQGAFISNEEVKNIVEFIKTNNEAYFDESVKDAIYKEDEDEKTNAKDSAPSKKDGAIEDDFISVLQLLIKYGKAVSISFIQSKKQFGFPRASRLFYQMEEMGYTEVENKKIIAVHLTQEELDEIIRTNGAVEEE